MAGGGRHGGFQSGLALFIREDRAANGAGVILYVAVLGAGGCHSLGLFKRMAGGGHNGGFQSGLAILVLEDRAARGADVVSNVAVLGAGRINGLHLGQLVAGRGKHLNGDVRGIVFANEHQQALLGAGGRLHDGAVIPGVADGGIHNAFQRGLALLVSEGRAAYGAGVVFHVAVVLAGGSNSVHLCKVMAGGGHDDVFDRGLTQLILKGTAAHAAEVVSDVAVLGAGGLHSGNEFHIVAGSGIGNVFHRDRACLIRELFAADRALVVGKGAILGAGRRNGLNVGQRMAVSGHVFGALMARIVLAGVQHQAAGGAGGLLDERAFIPVVAGLFDHKIVIGDLVLAVLVAEHGAAVHALIVLGKAVSYTGNVGFHEHELVARCGKHDAGLLERFKPFLIGEEGAAARADVISDVAVLGAGGLHRIHRCKIVAQRLLGIIQELVGQGLALVLHGGDVAFALALGAGGFLRGIHGHLRLDRNAGLAVLMRLAGDLVVGVVAGLGLEPFPIGIAVYVLVGNGGIGGIVKVLVVDLFGGHRVIAVRFAGSHKGQRRHDVVRVEGSVFSGNVGKGHNAVLRIVVDGIEGGCRSDAGERKVLGIVLYGDQAVGGLLIHGEIQRLPEAVRGGYDRDRVGGIVNAVHGQLTLHGQSGRARIHRNGGVLHGGVRAQGEFRVFGLFLVFKVELNGIHAELKQRGGGPYAVSERTEVRDQVKAEHVVLADDIGGLVVEARPEDAFAVEIQRIVVRAVGGVFEIADDVGAEAIGAVGKLGIVLDHDVGVLIYEAFAVHKQIHVHTGVVFGVIEALEGGYAHDGGAVEDIGIIESADFAGIQVDHKNVGIVRGYHDAVAQIGGRGKVAQLNAHVAQICQLQRFLIHQIDLAVVVGGEQIVIGAVGNGCDGFADGFLGQLGIIGKLCDVDLGEPLTALFIPHHAVERLLYAGHGHKAVRPCERRVGKHGGNHAGAFGNAGDDALLINGGNALVGGGPDQSLVHAPRIDRRLKRGGGIHDHGDHIGQVDLNVGGVVLKIKVDLIAGDVSGVVVNLDLQAVRAEPAVFVQIVVAEDAIHRFAFAGVKIRVDQIQQLAPVVEHGDGGDVAVILCRKLKGIPRAALGIVAVDHHVADLGRGVVDHGGIGHGSAVAQRVPIHAAVFVHVVLGRVGKVEGDLVALLEAFGRIVRLNGIGGPVPGALVHVIERAFHGPADAFIHHFAVSVRYEEAGGRGVADQRGLYAVERIRGIEGVALRQIIFVVHGGVAFKIIRIGIASVFHKEALHAGIILIFHHVGISVHQVEIILEHGTHIGHGGLGPVAVVAEHRDGMRYAVGAVGRADLGGVDIALNVVAVPVIVADIVGIQRDLRNDIQAAARGGDHVDAVERLEDLVRVVGIHVAVLIVVGVFRVGDELFLGARQVIEQEAHVRCGGGAVVIEVVIPTERGIERFAVHGPFHLGGDIVGRGIAHGNAVITPDILGKEIRVQFVLHVLVREVVQREADLIYAGTLGVLAQLRLDLTVSGVIPGVVHQNVAPGVHGVLRVGKARALLEHGIIIPVAVKQRLSGGHQQALRQLTHGQAGFFRQTVLTDVLGKQRGKAGDLRRCHGGTAHVLIGLSAGGQAVHGIDVSAGGGDLGLQAQIAGHAEAGERAHRVIIRIIVFHHGRCAHGNGAGVIRYAGLFIRYEFGEIRTQIISVRLRDGDGGRGILVALERHVDGAGLVVGDDHADGAVLGGVCAFFNEGDIAAVADGDLALQHVRDRFEVLGVAGGVDVNELLIARKGGEGLVFAVARGFVIEHRIVHETVRGEVIIGFAAVIHARHGQGVRVGAGGTHGIVAVVFAPKDAVGGRIRPRAGVARGDADDGVIILEAVQDLLIGVVGGPAGVRGAQGQVDGVRAEDHGVLNGRQVVGFVRAAVFAEHLHHKDLRVRCGALRKDAVQQKRALIAVVRFNEAVGRGDARHVGAVLALFVVIVGHVQIGVDVVDGERDLGADVGVRARGYGFGDVQLAVKRLHLVRGEQVHVLTGLTDRVLKRAFVKALMVGIDTGVDDGDLAARAGITVRPALGCAGHQRGGSHVRIHGFFRGSDGGLVLLLKDHFLHAGKSGDPIDGHGRHDCGDDVRRKGQVPLHVKLFAAQDLARYPFRQRVLLIAQALPVGHGLFVGGDVGGGKALFERGSAVKHNGYAHVPQGKRLSHAGFDSLARMQRIRSVLDFFIVKTDGALGAFGGLAAGRRERGDHHCEQHGGRNDHCKNTFQ